MVLPSLKSLPGLVKVNYSKLSIRDYKNRRGSRRKEPEVGVALNYIAVMNFSVFVISYVILYSLDVMCKKWKSLKCNLNPTPKHVVSQFSMS